MGNKQIGSTTVKLGIYEETDDSQLIGMLGQVKELEDGRKFVLCSNGTTALKAGILVQTPAADTYDDALVVYAAAAAGQKDITVTVTTSHGGHSANDLKDGFLVVTQGSGDIGTFYKIKENEAMVADSTAKITLYDNLTTALAATTNEVTVCKNPFADVVIDANTAPLAGVPVIAVTASTSTVTYFFWALFEGFGPAVATAASIAAGDYVEHDAGDVLTNSGGAERSIGQAITVAANNDALIVKYAGLA